MTNGPQGTSGTRVQWLTFGLTLVLAITGSVFTIVTLYAYPNAKGIALEIKLEERLTSVKESIDGLRAAFLANRKGERKR